MTLFWNELNDATMILTINQRLTRWLLASKPVQVRVSVVPWRSWVLQLWQTQCSSTSQLLNAAQENLLWRSIITVEIAPGVDGLGLASIAQQAYQTCQQWRQSIQNIAQPHSIEVSTFIQWAMAFEAQCNEHGWVTEDQAINQVIDQLDTMPLPSKMVVVGMDNPTPQLQKLLDKLLTDFLPLPNKSGSMVHLYACQNRTDEYYQAAYWAKQQSQQNKTVAVVVPELQSEWRNLQRIFNEVVGPGHYQMSGGLPLSQYPPIAAALNIVRLKIDTHFTSISAVARSRYISGAEAERDERDCLDIELRKGLTTQSTLLSWLEKQAALDVCPLLLQALMQFHVLPWPETAAPAKWAEYMRTALVTLGWPGEVMLNSEEYQAFERFYQCLETLQSLQAVVPLLSAEAAVFELQHVLQNTSFQPESPADVKIHILGMLETVGLSFDGLWLCNLSEDVLPQAAAPNPLLPISWQRQLNMPHASQTREVHYAWRLLQQWQQQTTVLYISYPEQQKDIRLEPSPLLAEFGKATRLPTFITQHQRAYQQPLSKPMLDARASAVGVIEKTQLKGGANILKSQALCPFQAFAKIRLHSDEFPVVTDTIDAKLRGMILHDALEQVWRQLQSHTELMQRLDQQDWQWLDKNVQRVLVKWQAQWPTLLTPVMVDLEQERLVTLIQRWLAIEAERPPFQVLSQEKTLYGDIAGIPLMLRMDRVDQLATGEKIIIDYKTGSVSRSKWYGERPTDPQLPLYATLTDVEGITFAKLHPKYLGFEGVSAQDADWPAVTAEWRRVLTALAQQFLQGNATVDPISRNEACDRCHLQSLCRIGAGGGL